MRFFFFLALWIFLSVMSVPAYAESPALKRIKSTGLIRCAVTSSEESVFSQISMEYLQKVAKRNDWKIEFVRFPNDNFGKITDLIKQNVEDGKIDFVCDPTRLPDKDEDEDLFKVGDPRRVAHQSYVLAGYLGHVAFAVPMCMECDVEAETKYAPMFLLVRERDLGLSEFVNETFSLSRKGNAEIMESVKLEHSNLFHNDREREKTFYFCGSDFWSMKSLFSAQYKRICGKQPSASGSGPVFFSNP